MELRSTSFFNRTNTYRGHRTDTCYRLYFTTVNTYDQRDISPMSSLTLASRSFSFVHRLWILLGLGFIRFYFTFTFTWSRSFSVVLFFCPFTYSPFFCLFYCFYFLASYYFVYRRVCVCTIVSFRFFVCFSIGFFLIR